MKIKIILRSISGIPIGISIGYLISIIISLIWGKGYYSPCVPELITVMGNEINAVIIQTILCGILGAGFAASSLIWEIEAWNIVKQTGVYFLIISFLMMPVSWLNYWMDHSILGFVTYFGIFALIFIIIWIIQYITGRCFVKKLNKQLLTSKEKNN